MRFTTANSVFPLTKSSKIVNRKTKLLKFVDDEDDNMIENIRDQAKFESINVPEYGFVTTESGIPDPFIPYRLSKNTQEEIASKKWYYKLSVHDRYLKSLRNPADITLRLNSVINQADGSISFRGKKSDLHTEVNIGIPLIGVSVEMSDVQVGDGLLYAVFLDPKTSMEISPWIKIEKSGTFHLPFKTYKPNASDEAYRNVKLALVFRGQKKDSYASLKIAEVAYYTQITPLVNTLLTSN